MKITLKPPNHNTLYFKRDYNKEEDCFGFMYVFMTNFTLSRGTCKVDDDLTMFQFSKPLTMYLLTLLTFKIMLVEHRE